MFIILSLLAMLLLGIAIGFYFPKIKIVIRDEQQSTNENELKGGVLILSDKYENNKENDEQLLTE